MNPPSNFKRNIRIESSFPQDSFNIISFGLLLSKFQRKIAKRIELKVIDMMLEMFGVEKYLVCYESMHKKKKKKKNTITHRLFSSYQ